MASDLISRKAMLERLEEWNTSDRLDKAFYEFTKNRIIEQPTVDAVEVVRCKDCNKRNTEDCGMQYECGCGGQWHWETPNSFCSWGEKKDGGKGESINSKSNV